MLSELSGRPSSCYDPTLAPHRDVGGDGGAGDVVHVYDYPTIRGLLRDARRVTSDVSEVVSPEQREHLHPVAAFVWATDRRTISGCPGRHAALRTTMAPWFTPTGGAERLPVARALGERLAVREHEQRFDVFDDYALPLVTTAMADWLGVERADVLYAVDDQLAAGEMFDAWPPQASPEMDEHYRELMARSQRSGVAAAAGDLVAEGVLTEREAWGIVYALSVSSVATAAAITLTVGLTLEHGQWPDMVEPRAARAAIEESVRLGSPFPQASRFVREPFTVGDVAVAPGDQVLMWLTAANRDLPGPHAQPLDRFDPERDTTQHLGWGSGYHLCAGVHHARALAEAAVTTLARRCPDLGVAGPWRRLVGIDDSFLAAPVARR